MYLDLSEVEELNELKKIFFTFPFLLQDNLPAKVVVDVLRHASKACVIKREFARAEMLVRGAVNLAWDEFGKEHPKFADALVDYGFYLLNVDCTSQSVVVYDLALKVRKHCFTTLGSGSNLNVAAVFEVSYFSRD